MKKTAIDLIGLGEVLSLLGGSLALGGFVVTSTTAALALAGSTVALTGSVLGLAGALAGPLGGAAVLFTNASILALLSVLGVTLKI